MKFACALLLLTGSSSAWTADKAASSRRDILNKVAGAAAVVAAPGVAGAYEVPDLLYPFEGLEPYIDAPTMKIHHDKHHATYVANVNKATEGKDEVPILDLMADALEAGPGIRK
jgi:Fe-Mn family superoxide dismutase